MPLTYERMTATPLETTVTAILKTVPSPKPETFTAYIEWDPATRLYAGTIPGVRGAHSQGATLDELRDNLKEVLELCLEEKVA